ncbi:MAG: hypothetical protein AAFX85_03325, partial [Pseudomonadota bacterium]
MTNSPSSAERRVGLFEVVVEEQQLLRKHLLPTDQQPTTEDQDEDEATRRAYSGDRLVLGPDDDGRLFKTMGLALSGGGIRAASFALGVMQGLNQKPEQTDDWSSPLLSYVDYLSTVSGGGYAGAAFTYYRH